MALTNNNSNPVQVPRLLPLLVISALEPWRNPPRQARPANSARVSNPGGSDPILEAAQIRQEYHSSDASHTDAVFNPEDTFLDAEQEQAQECRATEQLEDTSPPRSAPSQQSVAPLPGSLFLTNHTTAPPTWPIHSGYDMDDPLGRWFILLPTFTYAELPSCSTRPHRPFNGSVLIGGFPGELCCDYTFDIIDGFLQPASRVA